MAARVTASEVLSVLGIPDATVGIHIDTANAYVNDHLQNEGLSDDALRRVELYLAAHFAALTEERGGLTRSSAMEASESYANIYDEGLRATRFGQQAITLDSTGKLASMTRGSLKAQFRVV